MKLVKRLWVVVTALGLVACTEENPSPSPKAPQREDAPQAQAEGLTTHEGQVRARNGLSALWAAENEHIDSARTATTLEELVTKRMFDDPDWKDGSHVGYRLEIAFDERQWCAIARPHAEQSGMALFVSSSDPAFTPLRVPRDTALDPSVNRPPGFLPWPPDEPSRRDAIELMVGLQNAQVLHKEKHGSYADLESLISLGMLDEHLTGSERHGFSFEVATRDDTWWAWATSLHGEDGLFTNHEGVVYSIPATSPEPDTATPPADAKRVR